MLNIQSPKLYNLVRQMDFGGMEKPCWAMLLILGCIIEHLAQLGSGLRLQMPLTSTLHHIRWDHISFNETLPSAINERRRKPKTHKGNVSWPEEP